MRKEIKEYEEVALNYEDLFYAAVDACGVADFAHDLPQCFHNYRSGLGEMQRCLPEPFFKYDIRLVIETLSELKKEQILKLSKI